MPAAALAWTDRAHYKGSANFWLTQCPVAGWVTRPNRIRAAVGTKIVSDRDGLFDKTFRAGDNDMPKAVRS